jgi:hypothetical protein
MNELEKYRKDLLKKIESSEYQTELLKLKDSNPDAYRAIIFGFNLSILLYFFSRISKESITDKGG